jgi:hypothetical protein
MLSPTKLFSAEHLRFVTTLAFEVAGIRFASACAPAMFLEVI